MKLAIKKPKGVFWKTDLNHEDIHQMLEAGNITEEWLICGQGEAKDAVLISEFLENPSKLKPCQNPQKDEFKTKEPEWNIFLPWCALAYIPMVFIVCFGSSDPFCILRLCIASADPTLCNRHRDTNCKTYKARYQHSKDNSVSAVLLGCLDILVCVRDHLWRFACLKKWTRTDGSTNG